MTGLDQLWLPILVSSVLVFVASAVIHMASPWHKSDYPALPNEDKLREALRPLALPPGDYLVPRPTNPQEMRSPEFLKKMTDGPVLILTVGKNGPPDMGGPLVKWFVYVVVVGVFAGYVAGRAVAPGAPYLHAFRFVGATAFAAYSFALWQMSIWYRRSWTITVKATVDGLIYALLTAGCFGWLWPR